MKLFNQSKSLLVYVVIFLSLIETGCASEKKHSLTFPIKGSDLI